MVTQDEVVAFQNVFQINPYAFLSASYDLLTTKNL